MFDNGFISKDEVVRCINYLLCVRVTDVNEYANMFAKLSKQLDSAKIARGKYGYDRYTVWECFFASDNALRKIIDARHIPDIDYLLFKSLDYYNLDIPTRKKTLEESKYYYGDYIKTSNERAAHYFKTGGDLAC